MYFEEEYSIFTLDDFAVREANSLNEISNFKPSKKISELDANIKYNIFALRKVKTRWGERIVADLGEFTVS